MSKKLHPQTLAIRGGKEQTGYREHNQALFLTSSFMWDNAQHAADLFSKKIKGFTYTRTANPTIAAFEKRIAALEGAERAVATSTGMSAIQAAFFTFLQAGGHVVSSRSLFGTTVGFINNIVTKFGIGVSRVSPTDINEWKAAVKANTKLLFLETPSNPLGEVADLEALAELAHGIGALLVVDNSLLSPVGSQPLKHGADISVSSATKAIDGHGRVMGGVLAGSEELMAQVAVYCNSCGLAMSPFNAWQLLSGVETLSLRMEKQFDNALRIAQWLQSSRRFKQCTTPDCPTIRRRSLSANSKTAAASSSVLKSPTKQPRGKSWTAWNSFPVPPTSATCARPSPIRGQPRTAGCSPKKNSPPVSAPDWCACRSVWNMLAI